MTTPTGSKEEMEGRSQSQPSAEAGTHIPPSPLARASLERLLVKVEAATEGSRSLDGAICAALRQQPAWATAQSIKQPYLWTDKVSGFRAREWLCPAYSLSIDAALALVERMLGDVATKVLASSSGGACWINRLPWPCDEISSSGRQNTAPLAILAALLKALIADQSGSAGTDAAQVSQPIREAPTLPSREELERALREIKELCDLCDDDSMIARQADKIATNLLGRLSALTSKEQNNG